MSKKWIAFFTLVITVMIFGVLNYIVGGLGFGNVRLDLTQDKLYTLSDSTRDILSKLKEDRQVKIRLYVTDDSRIMPSQATDYARTVEDLILNMVEASNGKLVLEKFAPNPDTEDEDKAMADEIQGTLMAPEKNVYLGLAIQCLQQKEVIPGLDPEQEPRLEYELIRAIRKVSSPNRPVIGVMSSLPIAGGGQVTPQMMMMQQQQPPRAWYAVERLKMDYEVKTIDPATTDKIDDDIKTLLVVQPSNFPDQAEWAIDQFIMRGGKLIAFLDPNCLTAKANQPRNPMMMMAPPETSSSFKYLLRTWGVLWDPTQVVADMTYQRGNADAPAPTILGFDDKAVNSGDPATAQLRSIMMFNAGAFNYDKTEGLTKTPLVQSSPNSEMIDVSAAESALQGRLKSFVPDNKKQTLALRITGKFKSAFPGGKPVKPEAPEDPANPHPKPKEKDAKKPEETPTPGLIESKDGKGIVVLVGDVDMISDQGATQEDPRSRQAIATNSNFDLLLNVVEQAALEDGGSLINVRSRASMRRPFTKMNEIQELINSQFRPQMQQLQDKFEATSQAMGAVKLTETKDGKLAMILTPDQMKKKEELESTMAELRDQKRQLDKKRTREMDVLQSMIKWSNILIVPVLVALVGLIAFHIRRQKTAAA